MDINPPSNNQPVNQSSVPPTLVAVPPEKKSGSTTLFIVAVIAVLLVGAAVLAYIYLSPQPTTLSIFLPPAHNKVVEEKATPPAEDSTTGIDQQLNDVQINDVNAQFKDVDADLNKL